MERLNSPVYSAPLCSYKLQGTLHSMCFVVCKILAKCAIFGLSYEKFCGDLLFVQTCIVYIIFSALFRIDLSIF